MGFYDAVLQLGGLLGFWINYGVNQHLAATSKQWRIPMAIQLIPGGMFLICALFLVESPRWLIKVERTEKAQANLAWIRHLPVTQEYMQQELNMINEQIEREMFVNGRKLTFGRKFQELFKKGIRNRLAIGVLVFCKSMFPTLRTVFILIAFLTMPFQSSKSTCD